MRAWRRVSKTKGGFICAIGIVYLCISDDSCRYGDYLIAMNCTHEKTFEIDIPVDMKDTSAEELISGRKHKLTQIVV